MRSFHYRRHIVLILIRLKDDKGISMDLLPLAKDHFQLSWLGNYALNFNFTYSLRIFITWHNSHILCKIDCWCMHENVWQKSGSITIVLGASQKFKRSNLNTSISMSKPKLNRKHHHGHNAQVQEYTWIHYIPIFNLKH